MLIGSLLVMVIRYFALHCSLLNGTRDGVCHMANRSDQSYSYG